MENNKTFLCSFFGRKVGAIGVCYRINCEVKAPSAVVANLLLYDNYEHISDFTAVEKVVVSPSPTPT